jgi:Ser/Thr protein kinase RdoA (MazF antagonist)
VARVHPPGRSYAQAAGDAEILAHLEAHAFPAERLACAEPVSMLGPRAVVETRYLDGAEPRRDVETLTACGELVGRLACLPAERGAPARPAGALHHYALGDGPPANELAAAASWLDAVADRVPDEGRALHESVLARLAQADDGAGLPQSLLHPDPVLKNVLAVGGGDLALIDWTGAGRGPRLLPLAVLLWSAALKPGGVSPRRVDAVAAGFGRHVELSGEELDRLEGVMGLRLLVFACWRYRHAVTAGEPVDGTEWWWPDGELVAAVARRARSALATAGAPA